MLDGERSRTARRRAIGFAAGAALLIALAGSAPSVVEADGGPNQRGLSGWLPYYGDQAARRASFTANIDLFEEISPFWYHLGATGPDVILADGSASNLSAITSAAASRGVPVVPTIRDGSGKGVLAGWLADPTTRSQHADALVNIVVTNGFAGIDLDYEGFAFTDGRASWPALQPNWVAFVQELGTKLHAQGRQLHVTVPPIWLNANGTINAGSYTVYDWANIGASVDGLRVMTYDYSSGPVSPLSWVQATIRYAQSIGFDMTKLQIGIPLYGYDAVSDTDGTCPPGTSFARRSVSQRNVDEMIAAKGAAPVRDAGSGEMTFSYQESHIGDGTGAGPGDPPPSEPVPSLGGLGTATASVGAVRLGSCTVTRTVFYLDEFAVAERARVAAEAGAGVALWAIGMDETWTWSALRSQLAAQR
jgi:spore germination protein YaaH